MSTWRIGRGTKKAERISEYERGGLQKDEYTLEDVVECGCPLCGSWDCWRIKTERKVIGIVRCKRCTLIYVTPRLRAPEQVYWGEKEKYFEEARLIFEGVGRSHRDPNYVDDLRVLRRRKPTGHFLDIGAGMGMFLRLARNQGWTLYGLEPSPTLSQLAREYFGLDMRTGFLEEMVFPEHLFDVVTMTDVFEHIARPLEFLGHVARILKPGGLLFVKVPNGKFNMLKFWVREKLFQKPSDATFDSYEHVVHYTDRTLRRMLEAGGFRILQMYSARPVQIPTWHEYVGRYYQYPTPWLMDWRRKLTRTILYRASLPLNVITGRITALSPNIVALASPQ